jgi:glutamate/tyrosine decarboxylase-like PLP-dependent enzyme
VSRSIPEIVVFTHAVFGPRCRPAKNRPPGFKTDLKPESVLSNSLARIWKRLKEHHFPSIRTNAGPAELSTVCFRHRVKEDASEEARNLFNLALLKRIVSRGKVYLSNAELKGKFCLRVRIVNHLTMDKDIDAVVPEVLAAASEIMSEYQ